MKNTRGTCADLCVRCRLVRRWFVRASLAPCVTLRLRAVAVACDGDHRASVRGVRLLWRACIGVNTRSVRRRHRIALRRRRTLIRRMRRRMRVRATRLRRALR